MIGMRKGAFDIMGDGGWFYAGGRCSALLLHGDYYLIGFGVPSFNINYCRIPEIF